LNNGHTLAALAAAGGHVAVTRTDGCSPIIIWDPRSGRVLRVSSGFPPRDLALGECVDLTGPLGPVWLALDRKQALLSIEYPIPFSGDQTAISVMQAPLDPPGPARTLVEEGYTGDQGGTAVAAVFADGRNVAVQTEDAYSHRHPSVLVYQSPSSKPTTISGRALGLADGRLLVRDTSGLSVVRVDGKRLWSTAGRRSGAINGRTVVLTGDRTLDVDDAATGRRMASWALGTAVEGARVVGVAGGLALLSAHKRLQLVRLSDGRGVGASLPGRPTSVALSAAGLVYGEAGAFAEGGGSVGFVPRQQLLAVIDSRQPVPPISPKIDFDEPPHPPPNPNVVELDDDQSARSYGTVTFVDEGTDAVKVVVQSKPDTPLKQLMIMNEDCNFFFLNTFKQAAVLYTLGPITSTTWSTTLQGVSLANLKQQAASVIDLTDYIGGLCGDLVKP
jgi:hypothetical protein